MSNVVNTFRAIPGNEKRQKTKFLIEVPPKEAPDISLARRIGKRPAQGQTKPE
jgi:hypothetical protein